jgi:hypothetical protein
MIANFALIATKRQADVANFAIEVYLRNPQSFVMADEQESLRLWMRRGLNGKGRGARAELARRLNVRTDAITRMQNVEPGKETRMIRTHEVPIIEEFLGSKAPTGLSKNARPPVRPRTTLRAFQQALKGLSREERDIVLNCGKAIAEELRGYRLIPK